MKTHTFKGGIHPPEGKSATEGLTIAAVFPSTKMVSIPVTQGGAPNQPLVSVGDKVIRGQKIAQTDAFMSTPVHASVSGTVKKIENRLVTGNIDAPCIVIQADMENTETAFMPPLDPFSCTKKEALERVREAGIVGMGGAAFPSHVKLNPPPDKVITHVLANGAECEPLLTIDSRTMEESADKIVDGLAITMHITGAKNGIIVFEDNKKHLIPILETAIQKSNYAKTISICLCQTKYPQGSEKNIVVAALGKEIPVRGLPADVGCVIQNVGTLAAIADAFREGKPLIDRGLTIAGGACKTPKNIMAPVGTLIGDLIPEVIELDDNIQKIIAGGPMMGFAMTNASFPIQKNTSGVVFLNKKEADTTASSPCISCGRCISICSCRLTPVLMARAVKTGNLDEAKRYGLMDCVDCGSCSFVCPARINLVQTFRLGKMLVREQMQGGR